MAEVFGYKEKQISNLPENILLEIFTFLEIKDLCQISRVCKKWKRISCDNSLWRHVDLSPYRLSLKRMWKIIRTRFSDVLKSLTIRGFNVAGSLDLSRNTISEPQLKELKKRCPSISVIRLCEVNLADVTILHLPAEITELCLSSCLMSPEFFSHMESYMNHLAVLSLEQSAKVSDRDISHICGCQSLQILNLNGCYRVTHSAIEAITRTLTNLRELHLKETKCNDISLFHISSNLKNLEKLSLGGLKESQRCVMSSKGLSSNLVGLKTLAALDLSYSCCDDDVLKALKCLTKLKNLDVRATYVTIDYVHGLSEQCKIIFDTKSNMYSGDTLENATENI